MSNNVDDKVTGVAGKDVEMQESQVKSALDETSAGYAPSEWKKVQLDEIVTSTRYGASEAAESYDPDKPRYIRIKDIDELGQLKQHEKASLSRKRADGYFLEIGDMLFARSGSVGRTYLYNPEDGECCHGGYTINHKLAGPVNRRYLHQFTKSPFYWRWIERVAKTGAQSNINANEFGSLLIPIPPLPEQRKIASVLTTVDEAIQKTEAVIEQAKRVKRGLIQDLFTLGIEKSRGVKDTYFGPVSTEIPEDWEKTRIKDLFDEYQLGTTERGASEEAEQIPLMKMGNLGFGTWDFTKVEMINRSQELVEKYRLQRGDLLFNTRNTPQLVGKTAVWDRDETAIYDNNLLRLRFGEDIASGHFINYFFSSSIGRRQLRARVHGTTSVAAIYWSDLKQVEIPVPATEEQHVIVDRLRSIDKQIDAANGNRDQLKRLKRGLMQDLLTGRIRTADKDIAVLDKVTAHG